MGLTDDEFKKEYGLTFDEARNKAKQDDTAWQKVLNYIDDRKSNQTLKDKFAWQRRLIKIKAMIKSIYNSDGDR